MQDYRFLFSSELVNVFFELIQVGKLRYYYEKILLFQSCALFQKVVFFLIFVIKPIICPDITTVTRDQMIFDKGI